MKSSSIREAFTKFFEKKGHTLLPAMPIVNRDDPNLLFVNAGMNGFVSIFTGEQAASFPRVANSQPCLRVTGKHNDLETVGHDTYHHTLFEMLGNWSFGDYYKEDAIAWAWELLTKVYQLPEQTLYATVFEGSRVDDLPPDMASFNLWKQYLPDTHILYGSKADNFWEMGKTGPCGPCTEIHIDLRDPQSKKAVPGRSLVNTGHPEVIELWNLVFIAYHRQVDQLLRPLGKHYVDTGLGLERLTMVLQGKKSTYDTDLLRPLIDWLAHRAGTIYGEDAKKDMAMRVIVDHLRAVGFAIADGQLPTNQKAGYVIRRLLRRAIRHGYSHLGFQYPCLYGAVPLLNQLLGGFYPRVQQSVTLLQRAVEGEEISFLRTLAGGLRKLQLMLEGLPAGEQVLKGEDAFILYDRFGFPIDLTRSVASEQGCDIDEQGFEHAMAAQQQRAKKATTRQTEDWKIVHDKPHSLFVGYDTLESVSHIVKYRSVQAQSGTFYQLVLDQTPFYAEGGGQVGDTGELCWDDECIEVMDTRKEHSVTVHHVQKLPKKLSAPCKSVVDATRRHTIERNHTATHLLHAALRKVLGKQVVQKGSLVNEFKLRFDFAYPQKIREQEWLQIQSMVNQKIRANLPMIEKKQIPIEQAKAMGAMQLFGEKYGSHVRVVTFDPAFSIELCGGTHVQATGAIGFFRLGVDSSVAAGIRRLEAVTGEAAEMLVHGTQTKLNTIGTLLRNKEEPVKAVQTLLAKQKEQGKILEHMVRANLVLAATRLEKQWEQLGTTLMLIQRVDAPSVDFLKKLCFKLIKQHGKHAVALGSIIEKKVYIAIVLAKSVTEQWKANEIIRAIAPVIKGKGGGRPDFAIASGKKTDALSAALKMVRTSLQE